MLVYLLLCPYHIYAACWLQLMYFAGHRSAYVGLLRALSVVVGEPIPHIPIRDPKPPSRPPSQNRSVGNTYSQALIIMIKRLILLLKDDVVIVFIWRGHLISVIWKIQLSHLQANIGDRLAKL